MLCNCKETTMYFTKIELKENNIYEKKEIHTCKRNPEFIKKKKCDFKKEILIDTYNDTNNDTYNNKSQIKIKQPIIDYREILILNINNAKKYSINKYYGNINYYLNILGYLPIKKNETLDELLMRINNKQDKIIKRINQKIEYILTDLYTIDYIKNIEKSRKIKSNLKNPNKSKSKFKKEKKKLQMNGILNDEEEIINEDKKIKIKDKLSKNKINLDDLKSDDESSDSDESCKSEDKISVDGDISDELPEDNEIEDYFSD